MSSRFCIALLLLIAPVAAASQTGALQFQWLTPREITVVTGKVHEQPIRFRVVRVDNGAPVPGVHIFAAVDILDCAPLSECVAPPVPHYGYWEGAADPEAYHARYADTYSDAQGEVTLPRLVGGTVPWWYTVSFSVSSFAYPYYRQSESRPDVMVNQVAPQAQLHPVPAVKTWGLVVAVLAMAAAAWSARRARHA